MTEKLSPDLIRRIITRLENPKPQSQSVSYPNPEDEKVQVQVDRALEKLAHDPSVIPG